MGAPELIAAGTLSTFQPACFYRAGTGDIFVANGLSRPFRWDGITAAAEQAGITAPTSLPSIAVASGGAATAGDYIMAVQYIDDTLPTPVSSSIGDLVTKTATANQKFTWTSIPVSPEARVTQKILWRSTSGEAETLYQVAIISNATTSHTDTLSDNTLQALTNPDLPILLPNGDLNARRFGVPPSDRSYAVMYRDRVWMAGRVKYTEGTVATAGTTTVTGTGTHFVDAMIGMYLYVVGEPAPLVISSVGSATSLTLSTAAVNTASSLTYSVTSSPDLRNQCRFSEQDEPESMPDTNVVTLQENTGDEDEVTGLMPYGSFLYILKERHIYSLAYVSQPKIDVGINCVAWRGCLNHRCWDILDGTAFLMDQTGVYAFTGSAPQPIDQAIQNQFWDGTIDFTNSKWFWVKSDAQRKLVYFAVSYTGDNSTRPTRVLVYNALTQAWEPDKYVWELGGACIANIGGAAQMLIGTVDELVLATGQGTSDIVDAIRGTVTAANSSSITDSLASFDSTVKDAPVAIISGTGIGQIRRVSSQTSTQLTVSSNWTTTPDSTSQYLVGAIQWNHKTGQLAFQLSEKRLRREFYLSVFPTTNQNTVHLRTYKNKYQTPDTQYVDEDRGTGVTSKAGEDYYFDVSKNRVPQDAASSVQKQALPGFTDDHSNSQRWIALELYGFQGTDQISLDMYGLTGVTQ